MHLQQTKDESRASGGPQYYFHDVPDPVKDYLRRKGACPVVLSTPYGIAESPFMAVGRDHKLTNGKIEKGSVGHDRIQQAGAKTSIGEAIRSWYGLKTGVDFERIDVEVSIHNDGHFILIPILAHMRGVKRPTVLEKVPSPLSLHHDYISKFWRQQIEAAGKTDAKLLPWAYDQIQRVVIDHHNSDLTHLHEADLIRVSGALSRFGLQLGAYHVKGYDCPHSTFRFDNLPVYNCPVEVKKYSSGFTYQILKYTTLPRAVVLCIEHD